MVLLHSYAVQTEVYKAVQLYSYDHHIIIRTDDIKNIKISKMKGWYGTLSLRALSLLYMVSSFRMPPAHPPPFSPSQRVNLSLAAVALPAEVLTMIGQEGAPSHTMVIDVRSPSEYAEDHAPGAVNLPVLSDAERVEVGTMYKHDSFRAKKVGAAYVARNIARHLEGPLLRDQPGAFKPLVRFHPFHFE